MPACGHYAKNRWHVRGIGTVWIVDLWHELTLANYTWATLSELLDRDGETLT